MRHITNVLATLLALAGLLFARTAGAEINLTPLSQPAPGTTPGIRVPKPTSSHPSDTAATAAAAKDGDQLRFRNGDTLHGTVLTVVPNEGVRWRHPDVKDPVTFDLANAVELRLAPRPPRAPRTQHRAIVELTNGDRLAGDVVSLNDKSLALNTWYAGTLSIRRPVIQRLVFNAGNPEATYVGPTGVEDWVREGNRDAWSFKKGAFYGQSNGSIARDVKLPDVANIEFDLAWRGQLYFQFAFYIDDLRQLYNSGGYMFQFNYANVFLQRSRPQRGFVNVGNNVELPNFQNRTKAHVSVRVNKPKKIIALLLDGNLVRQWTDSAEFAGKGTGILFFAQGQGQLRVSNIVVSDWNGRLDTDVVPAAAQEDLIRFANNDKVSGTLGGIANNEIVFTTSFANMKIPIERVTQIELTTEKAEAARRQAADVRAYFLDGSRFTLALEKLDDQSLVGSTENCGRVTTALDAFSRVQFHIYDEHAEASGEDDWGAASGGGEEAVEN
jgi:hypothetical protein